MSAQDLPDKLAKYGSDHVTVYRIALHAGQTEDLPSFPASDKKSDPRLCRWFISSGSASIFLGARCNGPQMTFGHVSKTTSRLRLNPKLLGAMCDFSSEEAEVVPCGISLMVGGCG